MRSPTTLSKVGAVTLNLIALLNGAAQAAEGWGVIRSPRDIPGSCYVGGLPLQPPISEQYEEVLASALESRKAACQKAKELKTSDINEGGRCFTYSLQSIGDCRSEDVNLTSRRPR